MKSLFLLRLFLISTALSLFTIPVFAKTVNIPGDANSLQEAVELAQSGDEILIASEQINFVSGKWDGITNIKNIEIIDKDLRIKGNPDKGTELKTDVLGTSQQFSLSMWTINNSHVLLNNLKINYPCIYSFYKQSSDVCKIPAHIEQHGGTLEITNCYLNTQIISSGNLIISQSELNMPCIVSCFPYNSYPEFASTLIINSAENNIIEINSVKINTMEDTFQPIQVSDLKKSKISIIHSQLKGKNLYYYDGHMMITTGGWGSDCISMQNCRDVELLLEESTLSGGDGFTGCQSKVFGGIGLRIQDSKVFLKGGIISGGKGGNATHNAYCGRGFNSSDGGRGGAGAFILNSNVIFDKTQFYGGAGGDGLVRDGITHLPGDDGPAISIDENSTLEEKTNVAEWNLLE